MIKMPLLFTSFPGWQKIKEVSLAAGPSTDVNITGLNLTTNNNYMIVINLQDNATAGSTVNLYANGDATGANYSGAINKPVVNVMTRDATVGPIIFNLGTSDVVFFMGILTINTAAGALLIGQCAQFVGGTMEIREVAWNYNALAGNITSLKLHSSVASGIAVTGVVQIFKTI